MVAGGAQQALAELPQPGAGQLEVLFRRMLLQCTLHAQRAALQQPGDGADWRSDPKLHCVVEALQERLYDLEQSSADGPPPDVLALYKAHAKALADELRPAALPAYCLRAAGTAAGGGGARERPLPGGGGGFAPAAATGGEAKSLQPGAARPPAQLSQRFNGGGGTSAPSGPSAPGAAFSLGGRAHEQIRTQQRLQDELTTELLDMGQELKASTLAMQNAIRYRGKLLDDAEEHLVHSAANAQSVAAKAKQQYSRGRWNLCRNLLILLAVTGVFVGMMTMIKLTALVGVGKRR